MKKSLAIPLFVLLLALALTGCGKSDGNKSEQGKGRLVVVTTLFPLYDFVRQIGGDRVDAGLLLPPGAEPHSFEPKPGDLLRISRAGVFIYTGKAMEPWVPGLLAGIDSKELLVVDAGKGIPLASDKEDADEGLHGHDDHGHSDPHIWLDFDNARKMVDTIRDALIEKDGAGREFYRARAGEYKEKLALLDRLYVDSLSRCKLDTFVHGGHFAFNYLARRYHLRYISAYAGSPNAEPTPARLIELKKKIKALGIKDVFFEELIMPRVAEVLAAETGARLLKLNGAHNISREEFDKGVTFLSLMESNLTNLKTGLQCRQK